MNTIGLLHTGIGVAAVVLGAAVVFGKKGTRRHSWLGRCYLIAMLLLNATALLIYDLFGRFGPFHVAAIVSLATVLAGWWPTLSRRPGWVTRHAYFVSWSFCGLLAATLAEITSRVPGWDFSRSVAWSSALLMT